MKHLTVRGLPGDVAAALEKEKRERGTSLNQTVIELLRTALGLGAEPVDNGLARFAGTWTEDDYDEFSRNTRVLERIDDELWS